MRQFLATARMRVKESSTFGAVNLLGGYLLRAAGTGVAVANAPREVKMAADVVTTCRCCDGAVGEYLYAMLKECGV